MTIENAIKILEVAKAECEWSAPLEYQGALEMAIDALEKQIPKNPIVNGDRNEAWVEDSLICPVCNQYFGSVYNVGYCKTCGQKLIQKRFRVV